MSQRELTPTKIERRLRDNLGQSSANAESKQVAELPLSYPQSNGALSNPLLTDAPENMTPFQRLRYTIVVKLLHRINLTSYRRLRRAYAAVEALQHDLNSLLRERDEIAQTLRLVAADRDRLAQELREQSKSLQNTYQDTVNSLTNNVLTLSVERERLLGQVALAEQKCATLKEEIDRVRTDYERLLGDHETLRTTYERLQRDHETLRTTYEDALHKNIALEATLTAKQTTPDATSARVDAEELIALPLTTKHEAVIPHAKAVRDFMSAWGDIDSESEVDAFYYVLETSLRGSEAEIKQRQQEYLPHLTIADPTLPVVDLGCGRGEFLEIMREQGILAFGVDTNAKNIEEVRQKELDVRQEDVVDFLESAAPNSLAAVTAFQVIEHIPNADLRKLIKLAYEKLAPGGFLLLETVNPYCLETFRTYYLDPTHQNPVPLDLLSVLYQFYGFAETEVIFQNPIKPNIPATQSQALGSFYQNYALLGKKPHPDQEAE